MTQVLILYYTRLGNTEVLAHAVAEGARQVEDVDVDVKRIDFATLIDLVSCDAVAFGSPNYFGYMAGPLKHFFDKAWSIRDRIVGKLVCAFTSGGGSSDAALQSIEKMIGYFKLEKVSEGVASSGSPSSEILEKCRALGRNLAEAALKEARATPME